MLQECSASNEWSHGSTAVTDPGAERLRGFILQLTRLFNELDRQESACCGVTVGQCVALTTLLKLHRTTVQGLGDALGLAPSTITRNIAPLCEREWILRERDAQDRRVVWLSLSEAGIVKAAELEQRGAEMASAVLSHLPPSARESTLDALKLLVNAYEAAQAHCCPDATARVGQTLMQEGASAHD